MKLIQMMALAAPLVLATPALADHHKSKDEMAMSAEMDMNKMFVKAAAHSGHFEIESSRMAMEMSGNQDVQDFAQMMVRDHTRVSQQLKEAAGMDLPMGAGPGQELILASLEGMEGDAFDRAYIENQIVGHKMTIAFFEKMAMSGEGELALLADQTIPTLREHLTRAEEIASEMGMM